MANIATTKTYKAGILHKNEENKYVFEEYGEDENKLYDFTELLDTIVGQEGVSFTVKTGQEIQPDAEEI